MKIIENIDNFIQEKMGSLYKLVFLVNNFNVSIFKDKILPEIKTILN